MNNRSAQVSIWIIIGIVIVTVVGLLIYQQTKAGPYDEFAVCLKDQGVTFFGAFWCPHCQSQKAIFGNSAKLLPYVECSTPNGKGQFAVCTEKNITGYPTWEFADGSRESGELSLERLAEKSGCVLPQPAK